MTPLKLYLVRAVYDWAVENGFTPHLIVDASQTGVRVPSASVQEGKIVLNVAPHAVQAFAMDDQSVRFCARFGGKPFDIECPIAAVRAVYARENGQGVAFPETEEPAAPDPHANTPTPVPRKGPVLKRIK
ncbi:MAG TPA: ClpXP protease specificity-enhancing factor [Burkholderiales bacterium]